MKRKVIKSFVEVVAMIDLADDGKIMAVMIAPPTDRQISNMLGGLAVPVGGNEIVHIPVKRKKSIRDFLEPAEIDAKLDGHNIVKALDKWLSKKR